MFNKFKQKIADGVEGVSAGRQNSTISRVHRNIKENKENNEDDVSSKIRVVYRLWLKKKFSVRRSMNYLASVHFGPQLGKVPTIRSFL